MSDSSSSSINPPTYKQLAYYNMSSDPILLELVNSTSSTKCSAGDDLDCAADARCRLVDVAMLADEDGSHTRFPLRRAIGGLLSGVSCISI